MFWCNVFGAGKNINFCARLAAIVYSLCRDKKKLFTVNKVFVLIHSQVPPGLYIKSFCVLFKAR